MKLNCIHTNKPVSIRDISSASKVSFAVKMHLRSCGVDLNTLLTSLEIHPHQCNFCNGWVNAKLACDIDTRHHTICIRGATYGKHKHNNTPYYCGGDGCPGKKLNPNSAEFVSRAYGIPHDEALKKIYTRNPTPFYEINHSSRHEYVKSQRSQQSLITQEMIAHQTYKRSLAGMIERYGEVDGTVLYRNIQESKKQTKQSFIDRYGESVGLHKWLMQKNMRSKHQISSVDDIVDLFTSTLKVSSIEILKHSPPELILVKELGRPILKRCTDFNTDADTIISIIMHNCPDLNIFDPTLLKRTSYGYISYTTNGKMLRSKFERQVYLMLMSANMVEGVDFDVDICYPNSKQRCDFFFPDTCQYVEVAGLMIHAPYADKMNHKANQYKAIIVQPDQIISIIGDIVNEFKHRND